MSSRTRTGDGRTPVYQALASILRPFLVTVTSPRWSGEEHLHRDGGYIVAANHMTNFDPLSTAHFLYVRGRAPKIMAKSSLWKVPVLGWFLHHTGMIPVYRGSASASDSLVEARKALDAGLSVLLFPEGTLTKDPDLWPMAAKTGVARLALAHQVPVIPIAQWGTQAILPQQGRGQLWWRRPVVVRAGPPVDLTDLYDQPINTAALLEATQRVMDAITAQLAEIRGADAPDEYDGRAQRRVRQRSVPTPGTDPRPIDPHETDTTSEDR